MKWKIVVTAVIALLVVALVLVGKSKLEPQGEKATKERIRQYRIIKEEQQLVTDILTLRYNAAVIQSKFAPAQPAPAPVQGKPPGTIESMEYIPLDQIPPDAKVSPGMGAPPN